ncbi:hypothetical protein Y032_0292g1580 [Ancylostoma ceylanicum]|uniref:Uncharacterized protein n=1 Tax=Ancylostoma ceylanicum TaxID=53326 RepID=A0A016S4Y1_9BILA|nr:hypothetical protein Y032_0292g1580 [Ancylostoma ceylanicum]
MLVPPTDPKIIMNHKATFEILNRSPGDSFDQCFQNVRLLQNRCRIFGPRILEQFFGTCNGASTIYFVLILMPISSSLCLFIFIHIFSLLLWFSDLNQNVLAR